MNIGIIGHSRAGKTTVLTCLKSAFLTKGWTATEKVEIGQDHLSRCAQRILNGLWPEPTDPNNSIPRVDFTIANSRGVQFTLRFHDPSGELFDQPLPATHRFYGHRKEIIEHLANARGIIIMVDRSRRPGEIDDLITRNLTDIIEKRRSQSPADQTPTRIAVLITKCDTLSWQRKVRIPLADDWVRHSGELPSSFWSRVNQIAGEGNVHFFFSSASGWHSGMPNIRTAVQPRPFAVTKHQDKEKENTENDNEKPESDKEKNITTNFPRSPAGIALNGDHIPDPPQAASEGYGSDTISNPSTGSMSCLPIFSDPLRIAGQRVAGKVREDFFERSIYRIRDADLPGHATLRELEDARTDWIGVHELPGRQVSGESHHTLTPWNLVEPILWVAGHINIEDLS